MLSSRLWALVFSISALVSALPGCEDEELRSRCGPRSEAESRCQEDASIEEPMEALAGRGAADLDASRTPDASLPDASRADAGDSDPKPDDFETAPQCAGPTRYFAPGCPRVAWQGSPEHFAVQIAPGCYRPCTTARDEICSPGTRCGRAAFGATSCSGSSCAPVCAETWLCLSLDRFPRENNWDEDAGVDISDEDAGWRW